MFQLPLSIIAHQQFHQLAAQLNSIMNNEEKDNWQLKNGNNGFSAKKIYNILTMNGQPTTAPIKWIWSTCCLPKHKFLCWLMIYDRVNTCELLTRKQFHLDSTNYVLCNDHDLEDCMHLFFTCSFSQGFWWSIGIEWNLDNNIFDMILDAKRRYQVNFMMEIMIIGCWSLWCQRNDLIFEGIPANIHSCKAEFIKTFHLTMIRAKPSLKDGLSSWIDNV